jgi:iron complex outermembrane recepter protein
MLKSAVTAGTPAGFVLLGVLTLTAAFVPMSAFAQTDSQSPPAAASTPQEEELPRFRLPDITVTAQKEPEDKQKLPVSVTAVTEDTIENAGIRVVSDAAIYAPNTYFTEFTARKLSNAQFRGISASPGNPSITTFIDGVPQIHANSANVDLLDVQQIELVRGPQSALFGRNTLGGLVNVISNPPSRTDWTGMLTGSFGNHGSREVRGGVSGPVAGDRLSLGIAFARTERDGFSVNDVTGNTLDDRSGTSVKGQLLFTPNTTWDARLILFGERARDGDYALHDLGALRSNPFHASRDFEGKTERDIASATFQTRRQGESVVLTTTTGFVQWETQDLTDLDYSPLPLIRRDNTEEDTVFTQEVRLASADNAEVRVSDRAALRWQAGVFLFTQAYEQDAVNNFAPFVLSPFLDFPVSQHSPQSTLDDFGVGVFGQGTVTLGDALDLTAGARFDHERKEATLATFFDPMIAPPRTVVAEESFANVSPQVSLAYRVRPDRTVYATAARGFKAGGFNPGSPAGAEAYGEEETWNFEGGLKTAWANGRVTANAAIFYIDWQDLQLNVPNPAVPAEFFIANVGGAVSKGVELELNARAAAGVDVFGALGYTHARFSDGSTSSGVDVGGNEIPNTPEYTASAGLQVFRDVSAAVTAYGRAEVALYGSFRYDDLNREGQDAYSLTNLRAGVRWRQLFVEGWVRNAFDTSYVPVAFAYGPLAPSGFIGEPGAPRTAGLSTGVRF